MLRPDGSLDREAFWALWPSLRVLGRCSPQDKLTIVQGAPLHRLAHARPWYCLSSNARWKEVSDATCSNGLATPSLQFKVPPGVRLRGMWWQDRESQFGVGSCSCLGTQVRSRQLS